MLPAMRAVALLGAVLGVWCSVGIIAVRDRADAGLRLGLLPPWWVLAATLLALVALRGRPLSIRRWTPFLLAAWVCLLPWLPGPIPAPFVLWTGRLAWCMLGLSIAASVLQPPIAWPAAVRGILTSSRHAPLVAASLALAVYLWGAVQLRAIRPGGDEPHYLVITQSLLYDRDLQIENNHARRDYQAYFAGSLRPDYLRRGTNNQIYSVHAPGLPALILPAFAVGGYVGTVVFLATLMAVGTGLAWYLAWRVTRDPAAAWFGWASGALAGPFAIQAFSIYPDAAGSLFALAGITALTLPAGTRAWPWLGCGAALGLLPWLHTRYAAIALVLGAAIAVRLMLAGSWRALSWFAMVPAISAVAWFGFFQMIYGTPSPYAPYGGARQMSSLSFLPVSLPGLLFDQQFGLLANAPSLAYALPGIALLAWRGSRLTALSRVDRVLLPMTLAVLCVTYASAAGTHRMWWGGSSSPGRFLVPLVLPLTLPVAAFWHLARARASRLLAFEALAVTVLVTGVFLGVDGGRLAFNFRDGYSRLADWISPAADLASGLPSLIRDPLELAWTRIAIWLTAAIVVWVVLSVIEHWLRPSTAWLAAAGFAATSAVAIPALSLSWTLGPTAALRPDASQMALLRGLAWRSSSMLLSYAPWPSRAAREAVLAGLRLETVGRGRPGSELLALPGVPAGRYRVHLTVAGGVAGVVSLTVGRGPDLRGFDVGRDRRDVVEFRLPVDVRALFLRASADAGQAITGAWLEPVGLPPAAERVDGVAIAAAGYREVDVFALDENSYVEPGGLWIGPAGPAAMVFQRIAGAGPVRLVVSAGPTPNACLFEVGAWRERVALHPGESRQLALPAAAGSLPQKLIVSAERWFRPSEVNPESRDERQLGCRLQFP